MFNYNTGIYYLNMLLIIMIMFTKKHNTVKLYELLQIFISCP